MKKILIITADNYPHNGGKSTHINDIINGMEKKGIVCDIISRNDLNTKKIFLYKLILSPLRIINRKQYIFLLKKIELKMFQNILKKKIKVSEYDIINAEDVISCVACGKALRPQNMVLTMHTYLGLEYTLDNKYIHKESNVYNKLLKIDTSSINYVNAIICVDNRIKTHIEEVLKENKKEGIKVFCVKNFTNTSVYKPQQSKDRKEFNIVCVRRLVEKNGVIYAVEAMKYIEKNNIKLNIVGDGPEKEKIEKYIVENQLENKVKMLGAIDNQEIVKIYDKMDLAIVPSITVNGLQEATSISALEAMSCGIPTIASDIGGLSELIENKNTGILVKEKDSGQIADSIIQLYEDDKLYKKISENARNHILKWHSYIGAAEQYLRIYKESMEN